jgi:hypothetical protein
MTILQTLRFLSDWISSGLLLLATVLFLPLAEKWIRARPLDSRRAKQYLWLSVAGVLLVIPAAVFPAYWETGVLGQHRTVNEAYSAFLFVWFIAAAMWLASSNQYATAVNVLAANARLPLTVLLVAGLALTHNGYAVGSDLISGRLAGFDQQMRARYATLQGCRDRAEPMCELDPIQAVPTTYYVLDISADPHDWVNVAYARYFGVPEVRLITTGSTNHVRH